MTPEIKQRIEQMRRGEVPEGYKRAGVKIIPYNWGIRQMGEVCVVNPARPQMIPDMVSFLAMADVSEDAKIVRQKQIRCSEANNGFSCFCRGDILIAKITPCFENGKGAYTATLETSVGFGSTEFHVLRCRIDPEFIFFHTVSFEFRKRLEAEMTGTAGQKRVQAESIAKYRIAVPPIIEQRKIAAILTTQDKVIELKEKRLAEKQRQKKYLMQQLLTGKKRLPGFSGEWTDEELSNFCEFVGGGTPDTHNQLFWNGSIPWISSADLVMDDFKSIAITRFITQQAVKFTGAKLCPKGCILLVSRVGVGKIAIAPTDLCTSQDFTNIIQHKHNSLFLLYALYYLMRKNVKQTQGSAIKGITVKEIKNFSLKFPTILEQTAIAEVLTAADREIDLLRQEIEQEKQKKKALMQLLLTGIVRVNDDK